MAARKNKLVLTERWKERIRTSMLLNRLDNHVLSDGPMTPTQLDAAKFLLNKVISNAPAEVSGVDGKELFPSSISVTFK